MTKDSERKVMRAKIKFRALLGKYSLGVSMKLMANGMAVKPFVNYRKDLK